MIRCDGLKQGHNDNRLNNRVDLKQKSLWATQLTVMENLKGAQVTAGYAVKPQRSTDTRTTYYLVTLITWYEEDCARIILTFTLNRRFISYY